LTDPPSRAYSHPAKLCATTRRAPAAIAAATKARVPAVRRRFVRVNTRSNPAQILPGRDRRELVDDDHRLGAPDGRHHGVSVQRIHHDGFGAGAPNRLRPGRGSRHPDDHVARPNQDRDEAPTDRATRSCHENVHASTSRWIVE
jgi:hypothetical protein